MPRLWYEPTNDGKVPRAPWLAPEVIAALEALLLPGFRVAEHGSGGSTMWFAQRVKDVVAVEADPVWAKKVRGVAPDNVELIESVEAEPPRKLQKAKIDLLLIDGNPVEHRAAWLNAAEKIVKPGGIVVLDNANRPEYAAERAQAMERFELLATYDANVVQTGTKHLVTDFYRVPEKAEKAEPVEDEA